MLVLSRKAREQIQIGEQIVITILQVKGQTVRIGIEAPRNVRVLRAELPMIEGLSGDGASTTADAEVDAGSTKRPTSVSHRRTLRSMHPGEQAFAAGVPPLAAKLDARRAPDASASDTLRSTARLGPAVLASAAWATAGG